VLQQHSSLFLHVFHTDNFKFPCDIERLTYTITPDPITLPSVRHNRY